MKKTIFALVLVATLTACGNGSTTPTTVDSTKTDSTKTVVDSTKVDTTVGSEQQTPLK